MGAAMRLAPRAVQSTVPRYQIGPPSPLLRLRGAIAYVSLLAGLGLVLHHRWLTGDFLSAGDWFWAPKSELMSWTPWPSMWDPSDGFGIKAFAASYEFPMEAVVGFLASVGISWSLTEKLLYFIPFACLSLIAPWAMAREILGSSRWALLSALIFASSTYFLTYSIG